jgi:excisionase family DNA binding protein
MPPSTNDNPGDAPAPDYGRLLRLNEVADMFRVAPKTVTKWAREGKLASVRTVGGHRRYPEADVRELLNSAGIRVRLSESRPAAVR